MVISQLSYNNLFPLISSADTGLPSPHCHTDGGEVTKVNIEKHLLSIPFWTQVVQERKKKKKAQGTQEDTSILYIGFNGHQKEQITAAYIFSSMLENINLSWPLIGKTQCTCITEVLKSDLKKTKQNI